jgi:nucleoside-diphosphate-sugar epimerase
MKILFIGGTGRLSKDVALLSAKNSNEVYLLTRGSSSRKIFVNEDYHMIYGDIRNAEVCKQILKDYHFDVVIDFLTFNVEQLKSTLLAVEGKYTQYIFVSTATVYKNDKEEELISENDTPTGNDRWSYAFNKYACEKYLKSYFTNKDNSYYTIVRPYVTYGNTRVMYPIVPTDSLKEWTFIDRILNHQPVPVFDKGKTITTLTHTRDFAKGVVGLFLNKKAVCEAFHITDNETTTWDTVLNLLEESLGIEVIRSDFSQKEIYKQLPQYKEILIGDKGTTMRFSNQKIREAVPSFSCEVSLKNGIDEMIAFYNAHPELKLIDCHWNGEIDRLCKSKGFKTNRKYVFNNIEERIDYLMGRYTILSVFEKPANLLRRVRLKLS